MVSVILLLLSLALSANISSAGLALPTAPEGFKVSLFADQVADVRGMAFGDKGTLFAGSKKSGTVYALRDSDGDGRADLHWELVRGIAAPVGVAFVNGDLYFTGISKLYRFRNIEDHLDEPGEPEIVTDSYPSEGWHGWRYLRSDFKGGLIIPVGAPCNVCDKGEDSLYASITRYDLATGKIRVLARGIRNTVGFDYDEQGRLWFTDNGRDMLGDDIPPCELNRLDEEGMHFGFPWCHGGEILDPEYGNGKSCADYESPQFNFGAHTAPLGMTFYRGEKFPAQYRQDVFIAQHGSWNRTRKIGYRVMRVDRRGDKIISVKPFLEGFLRREDKKGHSVNVAYPEQSEDKAWGRIEKETVLGRPADVVNTPEGDLLVSDDFANKIYRVTYVGLGEKE